MLQDLCVLVAEHVLGRIGDRALALCVCCKVGSPIFATVQELQITVLPAPLARHLAILAAALRVVDNQLLEHSIR